jgi:hypothetical protein
MPARRAPTVIQVSRARDLNDAVPGSKLGSGWWACRDLNLGPPPYQAYPAGCVQAARALGGQVIGDMSVTVVVRSVPGLSV